MSKSASLIKDARRQAGLTQAQLALRLGVSQAAVAKLERPCANPRISTLEDVLRMTGRRLVLATEPVGGDVIEIAVAEHLKLSPTERLVQAERMYEWGRELMPKRRADLSQVTVPARALLDGTEKIGVDRPM